MSETAPVDASRASGELPVPVVDADDTMTPEGLEASRQRNIRCAKRLLKAVEVVFEQQNRWKDEVDDLVRREVEQDDAARALFKEVYLEEAQAAMNPRFLRWIAGKYIPQGDDEPVIGDVLSGEGQSDISSWPSMDQLLHLTPYAAVAPMPHNLSSPGRSFLIEMTFLDASAIPAPSFLRYLPTRTT